MGRRRGTVGTLTGRESCVVGEERVRRVYAGANKRGAEQTKYTTRHGEVWMDVLLAFVAVESFVIQQRWISLIIR